MATKLTSVLLGALCVSTICLASSFPERIDLEGDWSFTYASSWERSDGGVPVLPASEAFSARMPVPGYWDDHLDRLRSHSFWSGARFNPNFQEDVFPLGDQPPDGDLLFLYGLGIYQRQIEIPQTWDGKRISLVLGGVSLEAWIFVNGQLVEHHQGYSHGFSTNLSEFLDIGANELAIAVANTGIGQFGCGIRGYKGQTGGIRGPVALRAAGQPGIADAYVWPDETASTLNWNVELHDGPPPSGANLHWRVANPTTSQTVAEGSREVTERVASWNTEDLGLEPWSDRSPHLYEIEITLLDSNAVVDRTSWTFGLRRLTTEGFGLRLNGNPIMLRGSCEVSYYPETVTAPTELGFYRKVVRRYKEIGLNWLRFHTTVPPEEYMQAADEAGIMIQVEPPYGSREDLSDADWAEMIRACRRHPSVVLFCGGNEEMLDEANIEKLRDWQAIAHELAPDALYSPMQSLSGVEYRLDDAPGVVSEPFDHSAPRLARLQEFSDVFQPYTGLRTMQSNYDNAPSLKGYGKPLLLHESGILGSYLNLDLEHRYRWSRIGPDMFASVRRNLTELGRIEMAPVYYAHSTAWASLIRKYILENYRTMEAVAGYDFLGAIDVHWHRTGYGVGILNEFYEFKPNETARDILRYNGESILTIDMMMNRNRTYGAEFNHTISASLFGAQPLTDGELEWWCTDELGKRLASGNDLLAGLPHGKTAPVATLVFTIPELPQPKKLTIHARLTGSGYDVENLWDFYAFPPIGPRTLDSLFAADALYESFNDHFVGLARGFPKDRSSLLLANEITVDVLSFLAEGGRVLLLGAGGLPARTTHFQINWGGRVAGNLATVISDHPLANRMPNDAWCGWQFASMMNGEAVIFNDLDWPFDPIIDVASSYKQMFKQSNLFEYRVGRGKLLVCTLELQHSDPAAMYLLDSAVSYAQGPQFEPRAALSVREVAEAVDQSLESVMEDSAADWNYDYRAQQDE